jgi:hypothetical protein
LNLLKFDPFFDMASFLHRLFHRMEIRQWNRCMI